MIDAGLVRRLLAAQHPAYAALPVTPVPPTGTDHLLFRLGDDLVARLPRVDWAVEQPAKEHAWLPYLTPHLPVAVSTPVALGAPADEYPWPWTVCRWLPGTTVTAPSAALAADLAAFVGALRAVDATGGPPPGRHNFCRGAHLATRDESFRASLAELGGHPAALAVWEDALAAPAYGGPGVWVHGDLQPTNLLTDGVRLTGVIDWGGLGVGDPAVDLLPAWNLFDAATRETYRDAIRPDDAEWRRGRGWAVSQAVNAISYYETRIPAVAAAARHTLAAVLQE